jgi:hypothetical protein
MKLRLWSFVLSMIFLSLFSPAVHAVNGESFDAQVISNLLAFYPLEGNAQDSSRNNNHGQVGGASFTESGYEGGCYTFNGTDDYIQIPVNINPEFYPQLTMGAWVKANAASPIRQVISHDNGGFDRSVGIDRRGGGEGWSAFSGSGSVLGFEPVVLGEWVFLAVVYDQTAGTVRLYVNDKFFDEAGTLGVGHEYSWIGGNPSYGEYFSGEIDNVFIFGAALSEAQVAYLRQNGSKAILQPLSGRRIAPILPGLLLD